MDTNQFKFLMYRSADGDVSVNAIIKDETIWLTQKAMAELFGVESHTINYHLKEIYKIQELEEKATTRKIRAVQQEGSRQVERELLFYNLDAIISVGYRVNSRRATQFRIWATSILKEYIIKGFAMDDERLKQARAVFGKDYFRELLERVRSIRASERRIWQQITDIFQECSIDYDKDSEVTHQFYAMVQNKFHYAITGQTAAEIIHSRADHTKEHMGLTVWKNSPDGRVLKSDVTIAKNYLSETQIRRLLSAGKRFQMTQLFVSMMPDRCREVTILRLRTKCALLRKRRPMKQNGIFHRQKKLKTTLLWSFRFNYHRVMLCGTFHNRIGGNLVIQNHGLG